MPYSPANSASRRRWMEVEHEHFDRCSWRESFRNFVLPELLGLAQRPHYFLTLLRICENEHSKTACAPAAILVVWLSCIGFVEGGATLCSLRLSRWSRTRLVPSPTMSLPCGK